MNKEMKKTILITGGAGFLGSHLCDKYLREGNRVICIDNLQKSGSTVNIEKFRDNPNFKFIKHDIIDPIKIGEKIDWVMNFACPVSCIDLQVDPVHTTKSNVHGVINMLEIARENNAVFIQASSSDIYGVREKGDVLKEDMLGQIDTLTARACYEEGKRMAETIVMDYYRKYKVDVKLIRIFNTYGPNMYYRDGRVMSNFIIAALNNQPLTIYGNGLFTRCHLYVDDLIDGIDRMIRKPFGFIGPVNLGSTKEVTVKELAETVIKMTGSKSGIIYENEQVGDPRFRKPDISYAKKELDWSPQISLEDGVKKTIEHYRNIELPERKIIIFATTYYPDMGPAERAIMEMTKTMPETEFYILTVKSRKDLTDFEQIENNFIFRIGAGNVLGKYLFPIRGAIMAYKLTKKYNFRFVWSVMASYGGLAAVILKMFNKKINFLLTFEKTETEKTGFLRTKLYLPLYRIIFKHADSIYLTDESVRKNALSLRANSSVSLMKGDEDLANQIRKNYSALLDKQENKLARPL